MKKGREIILYSSRKNRRLTGKFSQYSELILNKYGKRCKGKLVNFLSECPIIVIKLKFKFDNCNRKYCCCQFTFTVFKAI